MTISPLKIIFCICVNSPNDINFNYLHTKCINSHQTPKYFEIIRKENDRKCHVVKQFTIVFSYIYFTYLKISCIYIQKYI